MNFEIKPASPGLTGINVFGLGQGRFQKLSRGGGDPGFWVENRATTWKNKSLLRQLYHILPISHFEYAKLENKLNM